jgi:hypothetical protein
VNGGGFGPASIPLVRLGGAQVSTALAPTSGAHQTGSNSHARRSISRPLAVAFYLAGDCFVQLGETVDVRLHRELETDGCDAAADLGQIHRR